MLTIDVANASNIIYRSTYGDIVNNTTTPTETTETVNIASSGLSKGAVGGIAAGCVIIVSVCNKSY